MFEQVNNQVERLLREAEMKAIKVVTPKIGKIITIVVEKYPYTSWWK